MNATYCDNLAEVLCVNQVRIDFTDKPITAWGGMGGIDGEVFGEDSISELDRALCADH